MKTKLAEVGRTPDGEFTVTDCATHRASSFSLSFHSLHCGGGAKVPASVLPQGMTQSYLGR